MSSGSGHLESSRKQRTPASRKPAGSGAQTGRHRRQLPRRRTAAREVPEHALRRGRLPRPTAAEMAAGRLLLAPWRMLTSPQFHGLERIPRDRPVLFVGNHTLMGVIDVPLLFLALHDQCGIFLRSLGDHVHFKVPIWRDLLLRFGTVHGTRENCRKLMRAGESILVFPGGGREVFKRRGERYHLIWKKRIGFARLAIEHGYTIVPFAAVGADDCFEIMVDGKDVEGTAIGRLMQDVSPVPDSVPPMVRGIGPTLLPRPQRFYFWFGNPIDTRSLMGREDDDEVCFAVRERARRAVQAGMIWLRAKRRRDPDRHFATRLAHQVQSFVGGLLAPLLGKSGASKKRGAAPAGPRRKRVKAERQ